MEMNTIIELMQKYAKLSGKYCLYIHLTTTDNDDDVYSAAPYLKNPDYSQVMIDGCGILEFNNGEEMEEYFLSTVGNDGPTELNSYSGDYTIYALTCGPDGLLLDENCQTIQNYYMFHDFGGFLINGILGGEQDTMTEQEEKEKKKSDFWTWFIIGFVLMYIGMHGC